MAADWFDVVIVRNIGKDTKIDHYLKCKET